jgi:phosphopantothenoylcysteine decarboxylase/phosphopantothenate--cysteine ligase
VKHASEKRVRKRVPLMVGNMGPLTFGQDDNELILIDERGVKTLERNSKEKLAHLLISDLAERLRVFLKERSRDEG